jgi:leader peptidase (prepilin peptidase)/N-methyltransferase
MTEILLIFEQLPALLYAFVFLLGLMVGSFLNVVIYRLPLMMKREWENQCNEMTDNAAPTSTKDTPRFNLVVPRSSCPQCGHKITALENIPVLSFLFLKGRCAKCSKPISARYPAIELLSAITSLAVVWKFGLSLETVLAILLTWALIALTFIDIDHYLLPDDITLSFLWIGLGAHLFSDKLFGVDLQSAVIGAIAGYLSLWIVYQLFRLITGKEGMGFGDFKLLALFGAWFGWQMLPLTILLSSATGAILGGLILFLNKKPREHPIPFANIQSLLALTCV